MNVHASNLKYAKSDKTTRGNSTKQLVQDSMIKLRSLFLNSDLL